MDVQEINDTSGVDLTFTTVAAGASETFENGRNVILYIRDTGGISADVTIPTPISFDGDLEVDDRLIPIEANDEIMAGPFRDIYEDSDKLITVQLEDVVDAEIEIAAIKV